jgi:glycosyltransferase involved in cell wall biosynthesis
MILSVTYARGHGVAVVIDQQFAALRDAGYSVIIAGPISDRDFAFPGCSRVEIKDAHSAAQLAIEHDVDLLIVHTPPFFSVVRWLGDFAPVFVYDYGEPPPEFFPDAKMRREVLVEKDHCLAMSAKVMAISAAVAEQSRTPVHGVIPLGNSHLGRWQHNSSCRRLEVRAQRGWTDKFVVFNVTRFHRGERFYKGIDFYVEIFRYFCDRSPELHQQAVFVLCGKGDEDDIAAMRAMGLTVIANVNDTEMLDIYHAADVYANFSRWEGYNLGIGQALAIGLPVVASDIPAHRAFGVSIAADAKHAALLLAAFSQQPPQRASKIWEWAPNLSQLIDEAELVFRNWSSSRL